MRATAAVQELLVKMRQTVGTGLRACALSDYTPQVAVLRGMAFPANIASEPLPALYNAREGAFHLRASWQAPAP